MDSEEELIIKLVLSWHLNVMERNLLPEKMARYSIIEKAIRNQLKINSIFPPHWKIDEGFDGVIIEMVNDKNFKLYYKSEVSMMRFKLIKTENIHDVNQAIRQYVNDFHGSNIDGIKIDWSK